MWRRWNLTVSCVIQRALENCGGVPCRWGGTVEDSLVGDRAHHGGQIVGVDALPHERPRASPECALDRVRIILRRQHDDEYVWMLDPQPLEADEHTHAGQ